MGKTETFFKPQYEVEIRCHFSNADEAYRTIPFLRACLKHEMVWFSGIYGEDFFKAGKLLRMSKRPSTARLNILWDGKAVIPALSPTSGKKSMR